MRSWIFSRLPVPALGVVFLCGLTAQNDSATLLAKQLYDHGKWTEVVAAWRGHSDPEPAADYYAGMALARLGLFEEARAALASGERKDPRDKRFPIELAGLAYQRKDLPAAQTHLKRALRLDPNDRYANDFLATVYFLRHNLEAALQHWNRIGKPHIEQIQMEPEPKVRPALLDQAFAMAPASVLGLHDLRATEASLDLLGIFPRYQFSLAPRDENEKFDLIFRASERNGWGDTKWAGFMSILRGAPYATIYPEWYNLGRSTVNITSLARFDPDKLRLFASVEAPVGGNPALRWRFFADGRKENWDLSTTGIPDPDLHLQKIETGAGLRGVIGDRWGWSTTFSLADRKFPRAPTAGTFFTNGVSLAYRGQLNRALLRLPEHRLNLDSSAWGEFGKLFARGFDPYARTGASVSARWFPQAQGDRYEFSTIVHAGKTFGAVPFDELFMLGVERDNDLPLRAHIGTRDGRKGSAPLGRNYFLWNADFDRTVYDAGFLKIKLGPFLDSGRITDPSRLFGSGRWLWDTGAQLKLSLFSTVTVAVSYGKDLRGGRHAFYATTLRP